MRAMPGTRTREMYLTMSEFESLDVYTFYVQRRVRGRNHAMVCTEPNSRPLASCVATSLAESIRHFVDALG